MQSYICQLRANGGLGQGEHSSNVCATTTPYLLTRFGSSCTNPR